MAQDFERNIARNVGTSEVVLRTANSDDALIGINVANVTTSQITIEIYITGTGGTDDFYIVKNAPIPAGSALQVLDGGAKIVMVSGDILNVKSNTASSADVWVSVVDAIST
tara:strand:- start:50 stop:382 length:333 start_codon:yes stop_codon:yes gene_type:complete